MGLAKGIRIWSGQRLCSTLKFASKENLDAFPMDLQMQISCATQWKMVFLGTIFFCIFVADFIYCVQVVHCVFMYIVLVVEIVYYYVYSMISNII